MTCEKKAYNMTTRLTWLISSLILNDLRRPCKTLKGSAYLLDTDFLPKKRANAKNINSLDNRYQIAF